jgi:hypothetical protein
MPDPPPTGTPIDTHRHPESTPPSGLNLDAQPAPAPAFRSRHPTEHPMIRSQQDADTPRENRTRIALAALTGLLAGATRAITEWLLNRLGSQSMLGRGLTTNRRPRPARPLRVRRSTGRPCIRLRTSTGPAHVRSPIAVVAGNAYQWECCSRVRQVAPRQRSLIRVDSRCRRKSGIPTNRSATTDIDVVTGVALQWGWAATAAGRRRGGRRVPRGQRGVARRGARCMLTSARRGQGRWSPRRP